MGQSAQMPHITRLSLCCPNNLSTYRPSIFPSVHPLIHLSSHDPSIHPSIIIATVLLKLVQVASSPTRGTFIAGLLNIHQHSQLSTLDQDASTQAGHRDTQHAHSTQKKKKKKLWVIFLRIWFSDESSNKKCLCSRNNTALALNHHRGNVLPDGSPNTMQFPNLKNHYWDSLTCNRENGTSAIDAVSLFGLVKDDRTLAVCQGLPCKSLWAHACRVTLAV